MEEYFTLKNGGQFAPAQRGQFTSAQRGQLQSAKRGQYHRLFQSGELKSGFHLSKDEKLKADESIKEILLYLKQFPEVKIKIHGYTSIEGDKKHNLDLSNNRAIKFSEYITNKKNWPDSFLDPKRIIETRGKGIEGAKDTTEEELRKKDRRIEILYVE